MSRKAYYGTGAARYRAELARWTSPHTGRRDGVHGYGGNGKLIGKIAVPESPANLCFGGEDGKTLFITARSSLYSIKTNVRGADVRRKD